MRGAARGKVDPIVRSRAKRIVAGLEPFESGEGEPTIRLQQVCDVLGAPRGEIFFPRLILRESWNGEQREKGGKQDNLLVEVTESHVGL